MHMDLAWKQETIENINLDFFIIFSLLIVKSYVSFLFWKKKWEDFDI